MQPRCAYLVGEEGREGEGKEGGEGMGCFYPPPPHFKMCCQGPVNSWEKNKLPKIFGHRYDVITFTVCGIFFIIFQK